MKKSLLAIVLAAATMPMIFAAQANQPAKSSTAAPAKTEKTMKAKKTKKAKKATKKGESKTTTAAPSTERK